MTGCFRRHTQTSYVLQHVAALLARLPVMRLWQRQRVVYVMAAETFHRRDSLRRACCQIVCENKTKDRKKEVACEKEQARRCSTFVKDIAREQREERRVSHYFSYSTEITSRDTLIKMCTHLSRFWLSPGHAHTSHTHALVLAHALPYQLPKGKTAKCRRHFQLRRRRHRQRASSLSGSKTHQLTQRTSCLPPPTLEIATSSMATVGA